MILLRILLHYLWAVSYTHLDVYKRQAYTYSSLAGQSADNAHILARKFADYNIAPLGFPLVPYVDPLNPSAPSGIRHEAWTPECKNAFNKVIADPNVLTGSKLVDNSYMYHSDANYNFRDIIKFAEIQVGGSFRLYELNSFGSCLLYTSP